MRHWTGDTSYWAITIENDLLIQTPLISTTANRLTREKSKQTKTLLTMPTTGTCPYAAWASFQIGTGHGAFATLTTQTNDEQWVATERAKTRFGNWLLARARPLNPVVRRNRNQVDSNELA